jgi:hypothetical protein
VYDATSSLTLDVFYEGRFGLNPMAHR